MLVGILRLIAFGFGDVVAMHVAWFCCQTIVGKLTVEQKHFAMT